MYLKSVERQCDSSLFLRSETGPDKFHTDDVTLERSVWFSDWFIFLSAKISQYMDFFGSKLRRSRVGEELNACNYKQLLTQKNRYVILIQQNWFIVHVENDLAFNCTENAAFKLLCQRSRWWGIRRHSTRFIRIIVLVFSLTSVSITFVDELTVPFSSLNGLHHCSFLDSLLAVIFQG